MPEQPWHRFSLRPKIQNSFRKGEVNAQSSAEYFVFARPNSGSIRSFLSGSIVSENAKLEFQRKFDL